MVNKWEIYFCNLDPTQGSEQRGTRPVLIISTASVNPVSYTHLSIAFFKMFTPYLIMTSSNIKTNEISFDISKMDEAFKSGKGYYELLATHKNKSCVFRFNIEAFRNNYSIADLTKMDLVYYGVKVGKVDISMLDISNEFNGEKSTTITSAYDI